MFAFYHKEVNEKQKKLKTKKLLTKDFSGEFTILNPLEYTLLKTIVLGSIKQNKNSCGSRSN